MRIGRRCALLALLAGVCGLDGSTEDRPRESTVPQASPGLTSADRLEPPRLGPQANPSPVPASPRASARRSRVATPVSPESPPEVVADVPPLVPRGPLTQAEKLARLYEKAFGERPSDAIEVIPWPIQVNGERAGEVFVRSRPEDPGALEINAATLLQALDAFLGEPSKVDLADRTRSLEWIDASALAALGIAAVFDEAKLEVELTVPPSLWPVEVRGARGLPEGARGATQPATTSGYLTARARTTVYWPGEVERAPETLLDLEGAVQVHGLVLEGEWVGDSAAQDRSRRAYTRLVYDDPARAIRYAAGDFAVPAAGFHDGLTLLGLNAARNFSLQPYSTFRPTGRFEFFLEQRSQVEIYVNDRLVDSLDLDAGLHDIRDFPLSGGVNRIRVVILNVSGPPRELDFSTAASAELLATGVHQFSYGLGFLRTDDLSGYDWPHPTASLIHRTGLTPTLTAQAYSVLSTTDQVVGVGQSLATRFGNLSMDVAASHATGAALLPAARLHYDVAQHVGTGDVTRSLGVDLEYRPAAMARFTEFDGEAPSMTSAVVGAMRLPGHARGTLEAQHKFGGAVPWSDPSTRLQLGLQGQLFSRVSVTLSGANVRTQGNPTEWKAGVTLLSSLRRSHQTVRASVGGSSLTGLSEEVSWNQVLPGVGKGLQDGASITSQPGSLSVSAHADVATSRGAFGVSHDISGKPGQLDQATTISVASSVAYAEGVWGVSSPIDGSFAVIARQARMKGQVLEVNPSAARPAARADRLGAAVLPDLAAYNVIPVTLDAPDLPAGYELGQNRYYLVPGYKTGTVLRIGNDASILIRGVLQRPGGELAAFATGRVVNVSEPELAPLLMFTSGSGHFFVEGLKPGQYELQVFGEEGSPYAFTLAPDVEGVRTLGTVKLVPAGDVGPRAPPPR